jgi:hypothetical protein
MRVAVSGLRGLAAVPFVAAVTACGTIKAPSCPRGQQAAVQELLYFGTDKPSGRVTPEDWARFLEETVTPKFPEGLTAWQASGQWRAASGAVVQEQSYVVSLVHADSASAENAVQEVVASYKASFQQEAVLRVKSNACISF